MKPYCIILLHNLTVRKFDVKDDWLNTIKDLISSGKTVIALKWSHAAETYVQQEIAS